MVVVHTGWVMMMQTLCSLKDTLQQVSQDGQMGVWARGGWPVYLKFKPFKLNLVLAGSTSSMQLRRVIAQGVTQPALHLQGHMHLAVPGC